MLNLPHWYKSRVKIHYFREKTDFYISYITKSKPKIRKRVNARKNFERWLLETYCLDFPNSKRTSALVLHYKGSHIRLSQLAFSQLLNQSGINRLNSTNFSKFFLCIDVYFLTWSYESTHLVQKKVEFFSYTLEYSWFFDFFVVFRTKLFITAAQKHVPLSIRFHNRLSICSHWAKMISYKKLTKNGI